MSFLHWQEYFYARDGCGHVKGEMLPRAVDFCRAMQLVAEGTYLPFKGGIYKQSAGLDMGSPASGDIANLYLCTLEDLALGLVRASGALLFYCRYIEDALALSVMEEADVLAECITGLDPSGALKLTMPGAAPQVDYLDLVLSVSPGKVVYRCHQKSLNRYLCIPFHSHQPQALQRGWIRAEALRYAVNCQSADDFCGLKRTFTRRLLARGYPRRLISRVLHAVQHSDRDRLLAAGGSVPPDESTLWIFKTPYSRAMHPGSTTRVTLKRELAAIQEVGVGIASEQFQAPPILSLKRPRTIGDEIARLNKERFAPLAKERK
jgi:hypothetical protein